MCIIRCGSLLPGGWWEKQERLELVTQPAQLESDLREKLAATTALTIGTSTSTSSGDTIWLSSGLPVVAPDSRRDTGDGGSNAFEFNSRGRLVAANVKFGPKDSWPNQATSKRSTSRQLCSRNEVNGWFAPSSTYSTNHLVLVGR